MKNLLLLCLLGFLWLLPQTSRAEMLPLPFGADAPDFTLTDLNGVDHTLSDYLDDGKMVILDFSAVWCGPCWNYHNTHILADIYNDYGPNGTDDVMVFFIEGDASTPPSQLYGGPGSQGNWVAGTPYPIMDDGTGAVTASYAITYFPTLYAICPNGKTYVAGQASYGEWENWIASCSLDASHLVTDALCFGQTTGAVNLLPSGGLGSLSYQWSNGSNTQDLNNVAPGTYFCTVTEGQGHTIEVGPIEVGSPSELVVNSSNTTDVDCFGQATGSASVSAGGGTPGYNYAWSNGQTGPNLTNVPAGNYVLTITDANGCTDLSFYTIQQPLPLAGTALTQDENCDSQDGYILINAQGGTFPYTYDIGEGPGSSPIFNDLAAGDYEVVVRDANACEFVMQITLEALPGPTADAGPDAQLDCISTEVILDGSDSDSGSTITYQWATTDGEILADDDTANPLVGAPGTYELTVTDEVTGCVNTATTVVTEDTTDPVSDAGPAEILTCNITEVTLDGSGSSQGSQIEYVWTTTDGNIVSGDDTQFPVVDASGTYWLEVIDTNNGCSEMSSVEITDDTLAPQADAGPAASVTCAISELNLDGTNSESGGNIEVSWSTTDGNIVSGENTYTPLVDAPGQYVIQVTNTANGCVATSAVQIGEDVAVPVADAGPAQVLNCTTTSTVLEGSDSESGPTIEYLWTTTDGNIVSDADTPQPTVDAPGTYEITVSNTANGCSATAVVVVEETTPVDAELLSQINVDCAEDADGEATLSASLGTPPYTYAWSSGGTAATETGLTPGIYTATITDADNCTDVVEVEILGPDLLNPNATATNETAAGADDGTATAAPAGGTSPYTYLWSTGDSDASITGLAPGTYGLTVTDANNCTTETSVTVGAFSCIISAQTETSPVSCNGGTDGTATLELNNALEPYEIIWSNGAEGPQASDLAAGMYTVSISDANNCPLTVSITIEEPDAVSLELLTTEAASCAGASDGSATVEGSGGTGSITYLWPNGSEEATATDLVAGAYLVTATDANGCSEELEVIIEEPLPVAVAATIEGESANEAADASISAEPTGGTEPYTYAWSNGETGADISNLPPGTYELVVTDANGCTFTESYQIDPFDCGIIDLTGQSEVVSCSGGSDGLATAEISGGTAPYSFEWFNGSTSDELADLPAGTYALTVTDANNCPTETEVVVTEPDPLAIEVTEQVDIECPGQISGGATVAAEGGTPGYSYLWEDGQTGPVATDLPAGEITVEVTDENGCTQTLTLTLEESEDDTPPEIVALSTIPVDLNAAGTYELSVTDVDLGSFDNCGEWSAALSQTSFSCADLGTTTVEYTVTDAAGNTSVQPIEVLVVDNQAPTLSCVDPIVSTACGLPVFFQEPLLNDNCSATAEQTAGLPSGSVFPEGETLITYQATDAAGNTAACSFTVTIQNTMAASGQVENTCAGEAAGSVLVEVTGGLPGYTFSWNNGGSDPVLESLPAGLYICTITDSQGCTTELEATVEEHPLPDYVLEGVTPAQNGEANGAIDVTVTNGTAPYSFVWYDIDGNIVGNTEDLTELFPGSYILEYTDANGCGGTSLPVIVESTTAVKDELTDAAWLIFPNPARERCLVSLELSAPVAVGLQLYDLSGRIVRQVPAGAEMAEHQWALDLEGLPAGLYLIRLQTPAGVLTQKLLVQ